MDRHQPSTRSFVPQRSPVFGSVPCESPMRLSICSTTGSRFELSVPQGETLEGLKRSLSQRLRIPKDRLVILHKETQMNAGNLVDQGVSDGSKLTLVPAVEAGLTPQPPRSGHTMIQALENLTETQVSDFLSGRSPLTLALGIGAHLMYVQLQLASQNAVGQQHHGNRNGGKVHSGKTGSSRVSRPYPSPTNPSYVSHTVSPVGTSSPPYHRTPVIRHPHPHAASPTSSPLPSHGPPPCLPLSSAAPLYPPHAVCPSPAAPSPAAPSPAAPSPVAPSPVAPSPAPSSPTPAAPFPEESCSSSAPPSREPGAVIESFVSHSPGVFSGTFSGTLPPISQGGVTHPRRGIATILQILNDLLSATRHHQGAPTSCQLRGPGPASPSCPLTSDPPTATAATAPSRATSEPSDSSYSQGHRLLQPSPSAKHTGDGGSQQQPSSSEENRALRRKLENLQLLMYQRRLCRRARRGTHPSHTSAHPYSQRLRHPWSPGQRKAARRHSNSSLSGSEGTSQDDTEADEVMEESPWKPELTSDLVVA